MLEQVENIKPTGKVAFESSIVQVFIYQIQSNRISRIENLENLRELRELYLSHNCIVKLEGLQGCQQTLNMLDVGNNKICKLENINNLAKLEEFWVRKEQKLLILFKFM